MKILVVTGSRADWGLLAPVATLLRDDPKFQLILAVTGQHLVPGPQDSLSVITKSGFDTSIQIDMKLSFDDAPEALAAAMGRATAGLGAIAQKTNPDMMLVLGDRYEILAAVSAALLCKLPVAHLCGGDVTEGAIDDSIRHAISKMASLHFVTTIEAAQRVAQMGECPNNIYTVGSTGLDNIRETPALESGKLWGDLQLAVPKQSFLVTFHPATLSSDVATQCDALIDALHAFPDATLIITGSNADPDARTIDKKMQRFAAQRDNAVFCTSLGSQRYYAALRSVNVVIGNSSSGLYEAPSFDLPTVTIDRPAVPAHLRSLIAKRIARASWRPFSSL